MDAMIKYLLAILITLGFILWAIYTTGVSIVPPTKTVDAPTPTKESAMEFKMPIGDLIFKPRDREMLRISKNEIIYSPHATMTEDAKTFLETIRAQWPDIFEQWCKEGRNE